MSAEMLIAFPWLFRTVVGGGILLLLVWAVSGYVCQPARRQRLVETGIAAAVIVALLALLPAWVPVPVPVPFERVAAAPPTESTMLSDELPSSTTDPVWDVSSPGYDDPASAFGNLPADTYLAGFGGPRTEVAPPITIDAVEVASDPVIPIEELKSAPAVHGSWDWSTIALYAMGLYIGGVLIVAGHWLVGLIGLWRMVHTAMAPPQRVVRLFNAMTKRMARRPRVLISRRLRVPVSCGILTPTVVIPARLCGREQKARLRWIFAHELTHLKRGDAWSCMLLGLGGAVYFFCPWFWALRRQVRLCQEFIADAAAVSQDARHEDYAQFLLGLVSVPAGPGLAMSVRGNASDLFRRVTMLLQNPFRVERRCPRLWWVGSALSLLAVAAFVSGIGAAPDKKTSEDKKPAVVDVDDEDPVEEPEKKAEKKKDGNKKKAEIKVIDAENLSEEIRKALENLPDNVDSEQMKKEIRKALKHLNDNRKALNVDVEKLRQQAKEALEQAMELNPDGIKIDVREALEKAQEQLEKLDNPEMEKKIREALKGAAFVPDGLAVFQNDGKPRAFAGFGQGRLGVSVESPSAALREQLDLPEDQGLVITQVIKDSAAAKAGLKANDILLELNGKDVSADASGLPKTIEGIKSGTKIDAVVLRKGKKVNVKGITLGDAVRPGGRGGLPGVGGGREATIRSVPGMPAQGGFGFGSGTAMAGAGGGRSVMTTVNRTNDRVNARHQEGSLVISLTGSVTDGKAKIGEIHIQDGGKSESHDSVAEVPERYRDKVKSLVEMCEKGNVKIDIKAPGRDRRNPDRDDDES
jgi:beta-lactamase regulating signal transducer with metallopeptidase domain